MKKSTSISLFILAGLVVGCGGGGGGPTGSGQVSGRVTTLDGGVVSGAVVTSDSSNKQTTTNSEGTYMLDFVPAENTLITAQITQGGTKYVGSNLASVNQGQRAKSVNIVVVPANQTATVHGIVMDNNGNVLQDAYVFAIATNATVYSSSMAETDGDGECWIPNLLAGQQYSLMATGWGGGYQSAPDNVTLSAGETRDVNFTLGNAVGPLLGPPTNLAAKAWTTPSEVTRSPNSKSVYEAIKNRLDPRRAARKKTTRSTVNGNDIEVDLYWDPINSNKLLGFGIYRGVGSGVPTTSIDTLNDPLASFYQDLDDLLTEGQTYTYQITCVTTLSPPGNESPKTVAVTATTLGDFTLQTLTQGPVTFNWSSAIGATEYVVYLYDQYPSLQSIAPIWTSTSTTGNQMVYTGQALVPGHVYYYFVVGDNGGNGWTISDIASFSAQ